MAKNSITDYSKTASLNTDIQSVDIDEGCLPSGINNAIRELMADLADMNDGTVSLTSPAFTSVDINGGTIDGVTIGGASAGAGTFTTGQFNTSLNVDGTVTSDGLTVDGNATIQNTGNSYRTISLDANRTASVNTLGRLNYKWNGNEVVRLQATSGSDTTNKDNGSFTIFTSDDGTLDQRLKIDSNGDISFYEDTGTTAKLFWDASAEALGLGTSSPSYTLDVNSGTANNAVRFRSTDDTVAIVLEDNDTINAIKSSGTGIRFELSSDEKARLDASGNLLVGTTSVNPGLGNTNEGHSLNASGTAVHSADGNNALRVNRNTSDGTVITIAKDGTTVGTIGTIGGEIYIQSDDVGLQFDASGNDIVPYGGGFKDAVIDLGSSSNRFKDLYLSNSAYVKNIGGISDTDTYLNFGDVANTIKAFTGGSERMRIDSSGNVLVGTTSSIGAGDQGVQVGNNGSILTAKPSVNVRTHISFVNPNGVVGSISTSGTTTTYNTSSDQRLKENIADADDAGSKVDAIQVRQFDWKADGSHQDYGMIAQELQTIAPEAVSGDADSEKMMGVDYSKLVPMLIKEIQSLRNRVSELEGN